MNLINLASWTWFFETINSLFLVICNWLYSLIGILYQVFEAITKVNLFDRETFSKITSRIYIIMGVAMLFIFAYNIILMIINPEDKKTTGNTGKVVKETIISLVLVILLPTIFNYMYVFQNHVITSNILGQIILGPTGATSSDGTNYDSTCNFSGYGLDKYQENHWFWPSGSTSDDEAQILSNYCNEYKNLKPAVRGAYSIAPTVLSAFYSPANFSFAQCVSYLQGETSLITDSEDQQICINYFYDVTASKYTGNIKPFVYDTYLKNIASDSSKTNIEFNGLMAIVAGCLAVWMFVCYAMEIGVRVAKLGVLQLISPIAVMMRIIPKQKEAMFDKWLKHLINTYLDVFIRLLIIFFALFAISLVEGVLDNLFASLGTVEGSNGVATFGIRALAAVIVILGILKFAQQAPDLLKEFFGGAGGNFSLNPRKVFDSKGIDAIRGGIYGATTGSGWGRLGGFFSGAGRGAVGGYDKAVKGIDTMRTERANGSTFGGRMLDRARVMAGMETIGEREERNLEKKFQTKERTELNGNVQKEIDKIKSTVDGKLEKEDCKTNLSFTTSDGFSYSGLNYANYLKLRESLQKDVENAGTEADKIAAQKKLQNFSAALEKAKKEAVTRAVTSAFGGGDAGGLLNAADQEIINSAKRNINIQIKENSVGKRFDESGNEISGSVWNETITNGEQLFGDNSLRDRLTEQRANISERSSEIQSGNYGKYQANSRVVRGQGKAEKK